MKCLTFSICCIVTDTFEPSTQISTLKVEFYKEAFENYKKNAPGHSLINDYCLFSPAGFYKSYQRIK